MVYVVFVFIIVGRDVWCEGVGNFLFFVDDRRLGKGVRRLSVCVENFREGRDFEQMVAR